MDDPVSGETLHIYKGGYWEAKEQGNWDMCPDVFWAQLNNFPTEVYKYTIVRGTPFSYHIN